MFLYNVHVCKIVLNDFVSRSLDRTHFVSTICLDYENAFDTIDHTLLIKKLFDYGFKSKFLTNILLS